MNVLDIPCIVWLLTLTMHLKIAFFLLDFSKGRYISKALFNFIRSQWDQRKNCLLFTVVTVVFFWFREDGKDIKSIFDIYPPLKVYFYKQVLTKIYFQLFFIVLRFWFYVFHSGYPLFSVFASSKVAWVNLYCSD